MDFAKIADAALKFDRSALKKEGETVRATGDPIVDAMGLFAKGVAVR